MTVNNLLRVLTAASAMFVASLGHTAPILTFGVSAPGSSSDLSNPQTAEAEFIATLKIYTTETFDGIAAGTQANPLISAIGSFEQMQSGFGERCSTVGSGCAGGAAVLDAPSSPFHQTARYAVSGANWLDSNNSQSLVFVPDGSINSIGFYLMGAQDNVDGTPFSFSLTTAGATYDLGNILGDTRLPWGSLLYVWLKSTDDINAVRIDTAHAHDGFGIDTLTTGRNPKPSVSAASVPEPASLALLGLGLVGAGLARRRRSKS